MFGMVRKPKTENSKGRLYGYIESNPGVHLSLNRLSDWVITKQHIILVDWKEGEFVMKRWKITDILRRFGSYGHIRL